MTTMHELWEASGLAGGNAEYLEALYEAFLSDPSSVSSAWRVYFSQFSGQTPDVSHAEIRRTFEALGRQGRSMVLMAPASDNVEKERKQARVMALIDAFRSYGHHQASIDPLGMMEKARITDLDLHYHGFSENDFLRFLVQAGLRSFSDVARRDLGSFKSDVLWQRRFLSTCTSATASKESGSKNV